LRFHPPPNPGREPEESADVSPGRPADVTVFFVSSGARLDLQGLLDQAQAAGAGVTFTCVPPGNGTRIGIDRDADGIPDRSDI
jgi:hypothetical protein